MPQAILLQDVEQLGERGAVVDVSKGYLRNFLIPRKLAEPATKGSIEAAQRRRDAAERAVGRDLAALRGCDRAFGGGLRELARDQVVAQVALRDVDDRPAAAQRLVVLEHDRLGHRAT